MNPNVKGILDGAVMQLMTRSHRLGQQVALRDAAKDDLQKLAPREPKPTETKEGEPIMGVFTAITKEEAAMREKTLIDARETYGLAEEAVHRAVQDRNEAQTRLDGMLTILLALLSESETF